LGGPAIEAFPVALRFSGIDAGPGGAASVYETTAGFAGSLNGSPRPAADLADASIVVMSELYARSQVLTIDRTDFSIRRSHEPLSIKSTTYTLQNLQFRKPLLS
jgi:hypothetical protein